MPDATTCVEEHCEKPRRRGYRRCGPHVYRHDRRLGAYVVTTARNHPLARADNTVAVHRLVLFDNIGPGQHPCHWCGELVAWQPTVDETALVVDHLDRQRDNNDPANLVPSCSACNVRRGVQPKHRPPRTHCRRGHEMTAENTLTEGRCKACLRIAQYRWASANKSKR